MAHGAPLDDDDAARLSVYGLLAGLLLRPDKAPLDWLSSIDTAADAHDRLSSGWAGLVLASRCGPQALQQANAALFVAPGAPAIDPYASRYLDGALHATALLRLREDLRQLGLQRVPGSTETEDHLGVLFDTMRQLIARGEPAAVQARFLQAHVLPWASRCLDDIATHPCAGPYAAVAAFTAAFLASEEDALLEGAPTA